MASLVALLVCSLPANANMTRGVAPRRADAPVAGPWYDRFHDDTLAALARASARHATQAGVRSATNHGFDPLVDDPAAPTRAAREAEADAAGAYVVARAAAIRLVLLADAQASLLRERQFVAAAAPLQAPAQALTRVDASLTATQTQTAALQTLLRDAVTRLAGLCGSTPDAIETVLRAPHATPLLPVFDARALTGADPDLVQLQQMASAADRAEQLARAREQEFQATELRRRRGDATDMDMIASYRRLLAGSDALTVAGTELALGWIRLARKVAGASVSAERVDLPAPVEPQASPATTSRAP